MTGILKVLFAAALISIGAMTVGGAPMTAVFDLDNQQAGVLKIGKSHVAAVSAWAAHVDREPPYGSEAIELDFFTVPLTRADTADIVTNDARQLHKRDFGFVVLFLDKARKIAQVNMTMVVPGTTVTRTVAYTPAQLADFANFTFDGKRLTLRSSAKFSELDDKKQPLSLAWNLDLELPVAEKPAKK